MSEKQSRQSYVLTVDEDFPLVVCLCGSTRFSEAFRKANLQETLAGHIVLSIGCDFKSDEALGLTEADKARLDALHLRKIELADEILVLNVATISEHQRLMKIYVRDFSVSLYSG